MQQTDASAGQAQTRQHMLMLVQSTCFVHYSIAINSARDNPLLI
jgi:hypothetical protein